MFCRLSALVAAALLYAQEPPVPVATPEAPKAAEAPKPEEPKTVLVYAGKPLKVPLKCGDDDIHSFGLTCSEDDPCEVYLELAGLEVLGNWMFLTGNLHTSAITLWSIFLVSEDAGKTWTEGYERIRSGGLDQVQFFDQEVGWVSGQLLLALPRDPFFLLTNDGGRSWRRRPVSSDSRVGAIGEFSFESRTAGSMRIESGGQNELYETNTGGESWSLQQVSDKDLKLKRPRKPLVDWRLRADAATKSYRVESRDGARWRALASFLVKAGECKPAPMELVEPPPTITEPTAVEELRLGQPPATPKKAPTLKKKPQ